MITSWVLLSDPDFWVRYFAEVEDVFMVNPPVPFAKAYKNQAYRKQVAFGHGLRCFWLDARHEWLVEFRKIHHLGSNPMWIYRVYELDLITRYQLSGMLTTELYWKRHHLWRDVPWAVELLKQAMILEALK